MKALMDYINQASVIINGIKKYRDKFVSPSINNEFFSNFESIINELKNLDEEQETLKVKFKSKTAQIDEKIDEMNKFITLAKNAVKVDINPKEWRKFGMSFKKYPNRNDS